MDDLSKKLAEIAVKHGKELAKEALVEVAFPALKLAVEQSDTKIDDAVLAVLEEPLKAAILELIAKA